LRPLGLPSSVSSPFTETFWASTLRRTGLMANGFWRPNRLSMVNFEVRWKPLFDPLATPLRRSGFRLNALHDRPAGSLIPSVPVERGPAQKVSLSAPRYATIPFGHTSD